MEDVVNNYTLTSEKLTHFRQNNKITTEGFTEANIEDDYKIETENATYRLRQKDDNDRSHDAGDSPYYEDKHPTNPKVNCPRHRGCRR